MTEQIERMLRFAAMDFNKFWVEVRSFPVFMDTLKGASLEEVENVLAWLRGSQAWHAKIRNPKLVFELAQPEMRKKLTGFARDARSALALRDEMAAIQGAIPRSMGQLNQQYHLLDEALATAEQQGVLELDLAAAEEKVAGAQASHSDLARVRGRFQELAEAMGVPVPENSVQAGRVLEALASLGGLPAAVRRWRVASVLDPNNRAKILIWRDRAQPIHDLRKRLEALFKLEEPIGAETLRKIAEEVQEGGLFRAFNDRYKDALDTYWSLRALDPQARRKPKESRRETVENLTSWAQFLDQVENFDEKFDGQHLFGPTFAGPETDFEAALAANRWAAEMREKLGDDDLGARLLQFLLGLPEDRIAAGLDFEAMHLEIGKLGLEPEASWEEAEQERGLRLRALSRLVEIARAVRLKAGLPIGRIAELKQLTEDSFFLVARMENDAELKSALRADYAGPDTDLSQIEQALAYVKSVSTSHLRDELKMVFLSAHGVLRHADARAMAFRPLPSLVMVHEHIRKLEEALAPRLRIASLPFEGFMELMHESLRQKRLDPLAIN
jgi:hypothetical protein